MAFEMTAYHRMMRSAVQNTGQTSLHWMNYLWGIVFRTAIQFRK